MTAVEQSPGIYIHVPFCSFVCPYCDFAVQRTQAGDVERYVDLLLREIELRPDFPDSCDTIYFGGGTPSLLSGDMLGRIIKAIDGRVPGSADAALHLEANPEDVTATWLESLEPLQPEFLSLGIQSLDDRSLRFLGRRHDRAQAMTCLRLAVASGIPTISADLMFGLPDQELTSWLEQLDVVAQAGVSHVSGYQLNVKPDSLFGRKVELGRFEELDDRTRGEFFQATHERLLAHGFAAYEVSNFSRSEAHQSRHNRKYWHHAPYLGIGPAAHSFDGHSRFWNHRSFTVWADALEKGSVPVEEREDLDAYQLALEEVMLGLRLVNGLDLNAFHDRYGIDLEESAKSVIRDWQDAGLVRLNDSVLTPTIEGLAVADALAGDLGKFL